MSEEFDFVEFLMEIDPEAYLESKNFKKEELRKACASLDLSEGGTKGDLMDRLIELHGNKIPNVFEAKSTIRSTPAKGDRV